MGVLSAGIAATLSSIKCVGEILAELPETLDETYGRMLREINKGNVEQTRCLLHCVTTAVGPLCVKELVEELAVWKYPPPSILSIKQLLHINHSFPSTSLMLTVEGLNPGKHIAGRGNELCVKHGRVTIETLPNEVLLKVFDLYFC
ncbi:hypothetical protein BJV74DRAFT_261523 [Russula compacta]|nr:hypothetical protein BJV74DRAFT_261523 [Russula compacta]